MIDAVAAVRAWGNGQPSLVGPGRPVALGFFERRLRSPGRGCYALVDANLDGDGLDAEGTTSLWRLSISVLSATDAEAAERGATAVADALAGLTARRTVAHGAVLLMAAGITVDNDTSISNDEPTFTVGADLYLASAATP